MSKPSKQDIYGLLHGVWILGPQQLRQNGIYFAPAADGGELKDDDQIWTIHEFNEWIVFQSSAKLYFFNPATEKFRIVDPDRNIYRAFRTRNNI